MALLLSPQLVCCLHCGHPQRLSPDHEQLVCSVCKTVLLEPLD